MFSLAQLLTRMLGFDLVLVVLFCYCCCCCCTLVKSGGQADRTPLGLCGLPSAVALAFLYVT